MTPSASDVLEALEILGGTRWKTIHAHHADTNGELSWILWTTYRKQGVRVVPVGRRAAPVRWEARVVRGLFGSLCVKVWCWGRKGVTYLVQAKVAE